jgi:signal transduction histidine kinase
MMLPQDNAAAPRASGAELVHELSNLLDGSLRHVSLVLARLDDQTAEHPEHQPTDPDAVASLRTASQALTQMADLLRHWSTGRVGMASTVDANTALATVVEHVVQLHRPAAAERNIQLSVEIDPIAEIPAGALGPVISNAVRNAIESIGMDGEVLLTGCLDGGEAELRIADDGRGVAAMLPRDTDGLVQPGITTKTGGHGLGLAISRDIVRAMGGSLRLVDRPSGGAALIVRWAPAQPKGVRDE